MNKKQMIIGAVLTCVLGLVTLAPAATESAARDSSNHIADRIVKSEVPVLVDFWATWCGPCRMLNPVINDLEKEYHGKVLFVKVNVDVHKALANYFGVSSIPAVFVIDKKTVLKSLPGLQAKETYRKALNDALSKPPATPPDPA